MYAFRCRSCGRLVPAEHAGENPIPASCPSCGAGVHYETGPGEVIPHWVSDPDNWQVLADATVKVLNGYGLTRDDVERHDVADWPNGNHVPQSISREAAESMTSEDHV